NHRTRKPFEGCLTALIAVTAIYLAVWVRVIGAARRKPSPNPAAAMDARFPTPLQIAVGCGTNFLDTLGIGSFATTTTMFRLKKMVDDRIIPGTLNVGHTLPTTAQTFIYTAIIQVDITTLFSMIAASILGAWLGAGIVARWPKRNAQIGMRLALWAAARPIFMSQ